MAQALETAAMRKRLSELEKENEILRKDGNGTEIPAHQEVPLSTVLAAYLDHGGLIPEDFPDLHEVATV